MAKLNIPTAHEDSPVTAPGARQGEARNANPNLVSENEGVSQREAAGEVLTKTVSVGPRIGEAGERLPALYRTSSGRLREDR